jgi:hypothetical protein
MGSNPIQQMVDASRSSLRVGDHTLAIVARWELYDSGVRMVPHMFAYNHTGRMARPVSARSAESVRDQTRNSLRTSPSGSSVIRQLLSNTIVWPRVGSNCSHFKPGWLGLPFLAKLAQAVAIFFASA